MTVKTTLAIGLASVGWLLFAAPAVAQTQTQRCAAAAARLDAVLVARDPQGALAAAEAYAPLPGCDDESDRIPRLRRTARLLLDTARAAEANRRPPAEIERMLASARRVAPTWDVLAILADRRHQVRDWPEATLLYQAALNDLADWDDTDRAPDPATIQQIYRRAAETALLAPDVEAPARRTGEPGGLDLALRGSIRNVTIAVRPMPITFVVNRATMTDRGQRVAEVWWETIRNSSPTDLVVIGHTDPDGPHEVNDPLSVARALAVRDFLLSRGFRGGVRVVGYGERCPVIASVGAQYSTPERNQILRRAEIVVGKAVPDTHCAHVLPILAN